MFNSIRRHAMRGALGFAFVAGPQIATAQTRDVDSLVARALAANPQIQALNAQASAARLRVTAAGAWSDPMLMAGIQNLPISRQASSGHAAPSGPEPMTMRMLGVSQTIPYPGKTSLRSAVARADAEVADARVTMSRVELRRHVHHAYFDIVAARILLGIVERQQQIANGVLPAAEARYVSGSAAQADILKARTEVALFAQERNALLEEESAAQAELNALLSQPSVTVAADSFPEHVAAIHAMPPRDSIEAQALQTNPRLRELRAMIDAQRAQAELAGREQRPDFDVSIQYGQRDRLPDMISAGVAVALPIQRGRKQRVEARAAQLDVTASQAELRAEENRIRSEVARIHAATERQRANLMLFDKAVLPQARATLTSASASYQAGRGELLGVLDAMRAVFASETMRVRTLAEYAKSLAELEAIVGAEVIP